MKDLSLLKKISGCLLILSALFLILSRISFDPMDSSMFLYPPRNPVHNLCGTLGARIALFFLLSFGEAFWILPLCALIFCYQIIKGLFHFWKSAHSLIFSLPVLSIAIASLIQANPKWAPSYGGLFGKYYSSLLLDTLGPAGTWILLGISLSFIFVGLGLLKTFKQLNIDRKSRLASPYSGFSTTPKEPDEKVEVFPRAKVAVDSPSAPLLAPLPLKTNTPSTPPLKVLVGSKASQKSVRPIRPKREDGRVYELPKVGLLAQGSHFAVDSEEVILQRAKQLEAMFNNFKIGCHVIGMERGPSITQFELSIDEGIKVNKITSLTDNIALTLRAPSVRVVAPIPGRNTIGIEIPNIKKEQVNMRSIMEGVECQAAIEDMALPLVLGKNVAGSPLISDLSRMPHLLVAGTTGSGKSVCINSIIVSLMMYNTPDQVRMIMVDPKMVEMSGYQDIPHLMTPVITDMNEAAAILEWACFKMDTRYALLANYRVRDIKTFNKLNQGKIVEGLEEGEELNSVEWPMPYLVIIVDEFSDLMMVGSKEIEVYITRLAQKSRAVGIHVILATQRPSVDVITGLIKTNMPSRIAFQVAAKIDSRTILDQNGADKLLGKGDMLFLPPGTAALSRAQGVMVSDEDIEAIVEFWKEQSPPNYIEMNLTKRRKKGKAAATTLVGEDEEGSEEEEALYAEAVQVVLESGRASASFIQRQLKVGYNKGSRLIELMEERGVVTEQKGSKGRDPIMTWEQWQISQGLISGPDDEPSVASQDDEN